MRKRQIIGTLDAFKEEQDAHKAEYQLKDVIRLIKETKDFGSRNFEDFQVMNALTHGPHHTT